MNKKTQKVVVWAILIAMVGSGVAGILISFLQ